VIIADLQAWVEDLRESRDRPRSPNGQPPKPPDMEGDPFFEGVTVPMRACVRVALVLMALSASFGLAGCAAIDELKAAFSRWVESEKLPSGRGSFADDLPDATPVIPPEKPSKKEASKPSKQVKSARKLQRPQTVVLPPKKPPIPDSIEAARPEGTEGQSAPSPPAPPRATEATTATLPQIEMARVKPVDRTPPNLRLSDDLIDLMKDFSLSSAQAIGGAWGIPLRPSTPFDERYGQW
jgi:hypothetical protein